MRIRATIILVVLFALTLSSCNSSITTDSNKTTQTTQALSESTTVSEKDMAEFEATILALDNEQVFDDNEWNLRKTCYALKYGDYHIFVDYDTDKNTSKIYAKKESNDSRIEIYSTNGQASFILKDYRTIYVSVTVDKNMEEFCLDLITGETTTLEFPLEDVNAFAWSPVWTKEYIIYEVGIPISDEPHSPPVYLFVRERESDAEFDKLSITPSSWSCYNGKIYFGDANTVCVYENGKDIESFNVDFYIDELCTFRGELIVRMTLTEKDNFLIYNMNTKKKAFSDLRIRASVDGINESYAYCVDDEGVLYRINVQTGKTELLLENIMAENFSFIDDWIYFNNTTSLYSFGLGKAEYVADSYTVKLCRMKPDGSQMEVL